VPDFVHDVDNDIGYLYYNQNKQQGFVMWMNRWAVEYMEQDWR